MTRQTTATPAVRPAAASKAAKDEPRIRVRGLGKHYGALEVFRNIDFDVGEREIVAIVGPSGCGKTTLLRCIDGLLPHDAGEIWVGNERVTEPIAGVAMAVGLDSTKEEGDAYEAPFLARGMATLIFEGPGQGEAQYAFAIRGDYEVPVKAVIDFVEKRRDLDAGRLGMVPPLGGYLSRYCAGPKSSLCTGARVASAKRSHSLR